MPLHTIIISILFHHYKELLACIGKIEEIEAKINAKNEEKCLMIKEEETKEMEEIPATNTTLDACFL